MRAATSLERLPTRTRLVLSVFALLSVALAACAHQRGAATTSTTAAEDSISGVVAVVGAAIDEQPIVRTSAGVRRLVATSRSDSAALRRLSGLYVVVRGRSDGDAFVVTRFTVRLIGPTPVTDGVLRLTNGHLFIDSGDRSRELSHPPAELVALAGARIWLADTLTEGLGEFGVIVPPP